MPSLAPTNAPHMRTRASIEASLRLVVGGIRAHLENRPENLTWVELWQRADDLLDEFSRLRGTYQP